MSSESIIDIASSTDDNDSSSEDGDPNYFPNRNNQFAHLKVSKMIIYRNEYYFKYVLIIHLFSFYFRCKEWKLGLYIYINL